MGFLRRRSLVLLALIASGAVPMVSLGSCGDSVQGSGATSTTSGAGAGGSTGVVLVGSGGGISSADCGGPPADDAGADGPTGCEGLDGGVAFGAIASLFTTCAAETCHGAPWTPPQLVGVPAYECCDGRLLVAPGNAGRSYLLDKLGGHDLCQGGRMPLSGPPYLPDGDVLLIRRWICGGALAN